MYAIVKAGGRQIKVSYGDEVRIDRIQADPGTSHVFDKVLLVRDENTTHVGRPFLDGVSIGGEVVEHGKAAKVVIFKKRRRKNSRRKRGFRAQYTIVRVGDIAGIQGDWRPAVVEADAPIEAPVEDASVATEEVAVSDDQPLELEAPEEEAGE